MDVPFNEVINILKENSNNKIVKNQAQKISNSRIINSSKNKKVSEKLKDAKKINKPKGISGGNPLGRFNMS